jgi:spore coat polysaccharide biosynthesis predicted glycosyltransferase SpsG
VYRFGHSIEDKQVHSEKVLAFDTVLIDDRYFESSEKEERVLFFLGDADYNKTILNNEAFFSALDMELLLGNYFFVKYEDALSKLFSTLHEPEEYNELIKSSTTVVTSSGQTALEAQVSGAKVIYLALEGRELYAQEMLDSYGIVVIDGFDIKKVQEALANPLRTTDKQIEKIDKKKILL